MVKGVTLVALTHSRLVVCLSAAVLTLAACSPDDIEHSDTPASSVSQVEGHHHSDTWDRAAHECQPPVEGAYPCAGGELPRDAKPIEAIGKVPYITGDIATLMLPSEHIGCEVVHDRVTCLVSAWPHEIDPDRDPRVPGAPAINLGPDGPIYMDAKADAPFFGGGVEGVPRGQILPYGTLWYHKEFVFASEHNGLTFWNVNTGHGALINADGYWPF